MALGWEQWQSCVAPLIDEIQGGDLMAYNITSPLTHSQLCHAGEARRWLTEIGLLIRLSFDGCGYGTP